MKRHGIDDGGTLAGVEAEARVQLVSSSSNNRVEMGTRINYVKFGHLWIFCAAAAAERGKLGR